MQSNEDGAIGYSGDLSGLSEHGVSHPTVRPLTACATVGREEPGPLVLQNLCQWAVMDEHHFLPTGRTVARLAPGLYEIQNTDRGIVFAWVGVKTEGLVQFPHSGAERVIQDVRKFWEREELFREFDLAYKRGILLYGPPGSGKSSTIQFISRDVMERGGIVVKFSHPGLFAVGMRLLREIEPATPVVALMEDIDSLLEQYPETEVLNILDGIDRIDRIVFLASTNYPERLGGRIVNRPSRFDKRVHIGHPNAAARRIYFEFLVRGKTPELMEKLGIEMDRWVADTKGFSIAHLKELFISVAIQGDPYQESLELLRDMRSPVSSEKDGRKAGLRQEEQDD